MRTDPALSTRPPDSRRLRPTPWCAAVGLLLCLVGEAAATDYLINASTASSSHPGMTMRMRGHCRIFPPTSNTCLFAVCAGPGNCCCFNNDNACSEVPSGGTQSCPAGQQCDDYCHRNVNGESGSVPHQSLCSFGNLCCPGGDGAPSACEADLQSIKFKLASGCNGLPAFEETICDGNCGGGGGQCDVNECPVPPAWEACIDEGLVSVEVAFTGDYSGDTVIARMFRKEPTAGGSGIPAASTWGIALMVVLLLAAATVLIRRASAATGSSTGA